MVEALPDRIESVSEQVRPSAPKVSIVVINKNEAQIEGTLAQLVATRNARPTEVEIVVVDASEGKFDRLKSDDIAVWDNFAPIPGRVTIPHQRNRGIALARGEIIVFVDSGCEIFEHWLDELTRPIFDEGERMVTGVWVDSVHLRADENVEETDKRVYVKTCPTLTVAISRTVFDEVGVFDESFAYGSDLDLCLRAGKHDIRILQNPRARVRANWGGGSRRAKRSYVYGKARMRLLRKHNSALVKAVGLPIRALVYPLYLLILPLSLRFRWLPVLGLVTFLRTSVKEGPRVEGYKYCEAVGMLVELVRPTNRRR